MGTDQLVTGGDVTDPVVETLSTDEVNNVAHVRGGESIQDAIDEYGSNTKYVISEGTYEETPLIGASLSDIVIEGVGRDPTTITPPDGSSESQTLRINGDRVTVKDLGIDGNADGSTTSRGLFAVGGEDIDIVRVKTTNTYSHGINLQDVTGYSIKDCVVDDFNNEDASHDGIADDNCEEGEVSGCRVDGTGVPSISGVGVNGIEFQDGTNDIRCIGNHVIGGAGINYQTHAGEAVGDVFTVFANILDDAYIRLVGLSGDNITDMAVVGNVGLGRIELDACTGFTIGDNHLTTDDDHGNTIALADCEDITVKGMVRYVGGGTSPPTPIVVVSGDSKRIRVETDIYGGSGGSNITHGVRFNTTATSAQCAYQNGMIKNVRRGVRLDADDCKVVNATFDNCDRGVTLDAVVDCLVRGSEFYNCSRVIQILNSPDENRIVENLAHSTTTAFFDGTPGSNTVMRANYGDSAYVTEGEGSASVSDTDTIAHGLSEAPDYVNLTASADGHIAVATAVGGTNITVGLHDDAGGAVTAAETVYWRAEAR